MPEDDNGGNAIDEETEMTIYPVQFFKGNANGKGLLRIDIIRGPSQGQTICSAARTLENETILARMAEAYNAAILIDPETISAKANETLRQWNAL